MSIYQYAADDVYSLASADRRIKPFNADNVVPDAPPTSESSIRPNVMSIQEQPSERTGPLQQNDQEVLKKKYFTELTVIDGKKYRFCKNLLVNRCKDTRLGAQKGRYSSSTSGSILKRHVEVCSGMDFDSDKRPKKDMKQTKLPAKRTHDENLALALVENMVY